MTDAKSGSESRNADAEYSDTLTNFTFSGHSPHMYKVIGGDHKEYGPISADQIREWIAEGRLNGQSLVQVEGGLEWKTLSEFSEFVKASDKPSPPISMPPTGTENSIASADRIIALEPGVQIGNCLSRSWHLMIANMGLLFGATFFVWLTNLVVRFIPLIGGIVHLLLTGVLFGGLYLIFLKRIRSQSATVGEVFAGFSLGFAQLMLVGLVSGMLTGIGLMLCLLPGIYLLIAWTFSVPLVADKRLEFWSAMELSRKVVNRIWFQVLVLVFLAFLPTVLCSFYATAKTYMMMVSMFSSSTTGSFDLTRIMELVKAGVSMTLLIQVVSLLNLPFALGAVMYAYEDIFGARATPSA